MTQPPPPGYPPQPPAGQAPNNHLVLSIVGLLFCLVPGIVAVVKATQVSGLWAQGRYAEAQASADSAKKWATWSIIVGAVGGVIWIALLIAGGLMAGDDTPAILLGLF